MQKSIDNINIIAIRNSKIINNRIEISIAPIDIEDTTVWLVYLYSSVLSRVFNIGAEKEEDKLIFVDKLLVFYIDK